VFGSSRQEGAFEQHPRLQQSTYDSGMDLTAALGGMDLDGLLARLTAPGGLILSDTFREGAAPWEPSDDDDDDDDDDEKAEVVQQQAAAAVAEAALHSTPSVASHAPGQVSAKWSSPMVWRSQVGASTHPVRAAATASSRTVQSPTTPPSSTPPVRGESYGRGTRHVRRSAAASR
jgi:hypothetical protein